jgi:hypothetical protein
MTDKQILDEVYATCKREPDVGSGEIVNIIEQEWQKRDEQENAPRFKSMCDGVDEMPKVDVKSLGQFSKSWYSSDVKETERHRGLEIGPDGTVAEVK